MNIRRKQTDRRSVKCLYIKTTATLRQKKTSCDSLEVGEDDQTDDQGNNGKTVTHHGHVVDTDGKLQEKNSFTMMNLNELITD